MKQILAMMMMQTLTQRPTNVNPCSSLAAMAQDLNENALGHEILIMPHAIHVQRLKRLRVKADFIHGDESPAQRRETIQRWLKEAPPHPLIISEREAKSLFAQHPALEPDAWHWSPPNGQKRPKTLRTVAKPLMVQSLCGGMLKMMDREIFAPQHVTWVVEGLSRDQRSALQQVYQRAFAEAAEVMTLFSHEATLAQVVAVEDALLLFPNVVVLCDFPMASALLLPVKSMDGEAPVYHAVYEVGKQANAPPWEDVVAVQPWASFVYHPHEWWRCFTRCDV